MNKKRKINDRSLNEIIFGEGETTPSLGGYRQTKLK